jgi:hypothetical protein
VPVSVPPLASAGAEPPDPVEPPLLPDEPPLLLPPSPDEPPLLPDEPPLPPPEPEPDDPPVEPPLLFEPPLLLDDEPPVFEPELPPLEPPLDPPFELAGSLAGVQPKPRVKEREIKGRSKRFCIVSASFATGSEGGPKMEGRAKWAGLPGDKTACGGDSAAGEKGFSARVEVNPLVSIREGDFVALAAFYGHFAPVQCATVAGIPFLPGFASGSRAMRVCI